MMIRNQDLAIKIFGIDGKMSGWARLITPNFWMYTDYFYSLKLSNALSEKAWSNSVGTEEKLKILSHFP